MNETEGLSVTEPLAGETAKAFAAYCLYRDLPPSTRSIDAAFRLQRQNEGRTAAVGERAPRHWFVWSAEHEWAARAERHDVETSRRQSELAQRRHTETIVETHARIWETAKAGRVLSAKAALRLDAALDNKAATPHELLALARVWALLSQSAMQAENVASGAAGLLTILAGRETDELPV